MRLSASHVLTHSIARLPRGWLVLALALTSWVMVGVAWTGLSQLFNMVLATF